MGFIYTRRCVGKEGREFDLYKVRTMGMGSDKQFDKLILNGARLDSYGKMIDDPRILSTFHRFLRARHLDELPQLYNLYRGDLKLVGVRPMSTEVWKRYPTEIKKRILEQKPGLCGIQYAFPRTENFEDNIRYLSIYLDDWEGDPTKTDEKYFIKIWKNILFNGVRSS